MNVNTPAIVINKSSVAEDVNFVKEHCDKAGCKLLFAMKSQSLKPVLDIIVKDSSGLAASSLFEARLASETIKIGQSVHFTSPGLRPDEMDEISEISDYIVFNSLSQWDRFSEECMKKSQCGLRINPQKSFIEDDRYDPCKKFSKLGAAIDLFAERFKRKPEEFKGLSGIHIHTNCESVEFKQLDKSVEILEKKIPEVLQHIRWINLGGGYLFQESEDIDLFYAVVKRLKENYDVEVMIEPGASISREGISIISSVIDMFQCDGKDIAILDTTVNHMPDIFEYSYRPDIEGEVQGGKYSYVFAGGTCLAGDAFGEFSFESPLEVGSKVTFLYVGAYNHVKSHMFNGINLPEVYTYSKEKGYTLEKSFSYKDYKNFFGA